MLPADLAWFYCTALEGARTCNNGEWMAKARRSRKKAVMATRLTFQPDRLLAERSILHFPNLMHVSEGILQTQAKLDRKLNNWRSFLLGGRFGRSLLCPRPEQSKIPVAVGPMPGAYLLTETQFIPIRGEMKKFLFRHTHTHTHRQLKRRGPPGPGACAHVSLGKNKQNCWRFWGERIHSRSQPFFSSSSETFVWFFKTLSGFILLPLQVFAIRSTARWKRNSGSRGFKEVSLGRYRSLHSSLSLCLCLSLSLSLSLSPRLLSLSPIPLTHFLSLPLPLPFLSLSPSPSLSLSPCRVVPFLCLSLSLSFLLLSV